MNNQLRMTSIIPKILACSVALTLAGSNASAVDNDLRIIPQIIAGTAGVEPGLALEWRGMDRSNLIVRPEIFVSEDEEIGAGGAVLWDLSRDFDLPQRHAIAIGPRVVYHNSDRYSWEADAMATWSFDLMTEDAWKHAVGAIGAVGVIHDKKEDENDIGVSAGIFYSYRF